MNSKGTSELVSTMIVIVISLTTALAATVYTNSLASNRMEEHSETVSEIINKNNEELVIVHAEYSEDNQSCNGLGVWVYNSGSIDTNVVKVVINDEELDLPQSTFLPRSSITILCFDYSTQGTHNLVIECTYGNKDEYVVNI